MNLYARVDNKLAKWTTHMEDIGLAQMEVQMDLTNIKASGHKIAGPVLAVISRPEDFYFASEWSGHKSPISS